MPRSSLHLTALATVFAAALAITVPAPAAPSASYTLAATKQCLVARGARVTAVRPIDVRFRALHDLAQRNSIQATSRLGTVGIAISRSPGDAALLAELLQVPRDPYHVVLRKNALLMFRTKSKPAFDATVACLRPR